MRILIIGAGNTGRNLAATLCGMAHDIVVIDHDAAALAEIESAFDAMTLQGGGSNPRILEKANVAGADLVIAVTQQDEVNILACLYARAAGVRKTVARVSDTDYLDAARWDLKQMGVDLLVSQNEACARDLHDILMHPGALDVVDLLDGRVYAVGTRIEADSPLAGVPLDTLGNVFAMLADIRFIALRRDDQLIVPRGETRFQVGDEVYIIARPGDVNGFLDWVCPERPRLKRIAIAGGSILGIALARRLAADPPDVVLIEADATLAGQCADRLDRTRVLQGDASRKDVLEEAGVGPGAAFAAITEDDELNIVSCILAKKMGAAWTIARVSKPEYVPIVRHMQLLDRVVSPYLSIINAILHYVRGSHVKAASLFQQLPGEILEVTISEHNAWGQQTLREVRTPPGVVVAMVKRNDDVHIPTGAFAFHPGDRLVLFSDPRNVERLTAMFRK